MSNPSEERPPYKAVQVANKFIELGKRDGVCDLTNMKLQKLVFFAHSAMLGDYDRPLIEEEFRAWKHGPVVYDLYATIRNLCNRRHLKPRSPLFEKIPGDFSPITDQDALKAIFIAWKVCKNSNTKVLRKMTRLPGTPWSNVYETFGLYAVIPNTKIRDYMHNPPQESIS